MTLEEKQAEIDRLCHKAVNYAKTQMDTTRVLDAEVVRELGALASAEIFRQAMRGEWVKFGIMTRDDISSVEAKTSDARLDGIGTIAPQLYIPFEIISDKLSTAMKPEPLPIARALPPRRDPARDNDQQSISDRSDWTNIDGDMTNNTPRGNRG